MYFVICYKMQIVEYLKYNVFCHLLQMQIVEYLKCNVFCHLLQMQKCRIP